MYFFILPFPAPPGWRSGQTAAICLSSAGWFPVRLCCLCSPPDSLAQWQTAWLHSAHTLPGCGQVRWPLLVAAWPPAFAWDSPGVWRRSGDPFLFFLVCNILVYTLCLGYTFWLDRDKITESASGWKMVPTIWKYHDILDILSQWDFFV